MPENEAPILITQPEFIRRMMEQQRMGGGGFYGAFPEMYQLVINGNHPVMGKLLKMKSVRQKETVKQLIDLAMLSQGLLKGEALTEFIQRSVSEMVES
jgi:molecular chaperone HtpG